MSYFDISIDNDITYLLSEIGNNIKINNVDSKAIVNNASMERTFDDKRIITNEELRRGDYVQYNNLFFIVLNEINDMRYNSYYKAIIRRCNFDVKFVINDKLYLFYSIVESDSFNINENRIISTSADTMTVTIPYSDVAKQIKKQDVFIKFNQKWKIQGIDYTKSGLVILNCKVGLIDKATDDLKNEIANRYINSKDILNGNIEPILPFSDVEPEPEPVEDITWLGNCKDITVQTGTSIEDITLPTKVTVLLDGSITKQLQVEWDTSSYNGDVAGTYSLVGNITLVEGIANTNNMQPTINIIVKDVPTGDNFTIQIQGSDELYLMKEPKQDTYIAKVLNNNVEVDKQVTFTIDNNNLATMKPQGNNQCILDATNNFKVGKVILKATLTDDSTIFAEKEIWIKSY